MVRLRAEAFGEEVQGGDFLGIHVVGERLRALAFPRRDAWWATSISPRSGAASACLAHVTKAAFADIRSVAQYLAANAAWLAARGLQSWSHETAQVRAPIEGSVVGAGAVVEAPARNSVVWPGAHVLAPCDAAVVTRKAIAR